MPPLYRPAARATVNVTVRSGLGQVGLARRIQPSCDGLGEGGMTAEVVVGDEHDRRSLARVGDEVRVADDAHELEARPPARLGVAEHVALLAQLEVDLSQLETVEGGCHGVDALAGERALFGARDE